MRELANRLKGWRLRTLMRRDWQTVIYQKLVLWKQATLSRKMRLLLVEQVATEDGTESGFHFTLVARGRELT